ISQNRKSTIGNVGYIVPTILNFLKYKPLALTLRCLEASKDFKGAVIISHASEYAKGLNPAPQAIGDSLWACIFEQQGKWDYLPWISRLLFKRSVSDLVSQYVNSNSFTISSSLAGQFPVQADGDFIGYTPVTVSL